MSSLNDSFARKLRWLDFLVYENSTVKRFNFWVVLYCCRLENVSSELERMNFIYLLSKEINVAGKF